MNTTSARRAMHKLAPFRFAAVFIVLLVALLIPAISGFTAKGECKTSQVEVGSSGRVSHSQLVVDISPALGFAGRTESNVVVDTHGADVACPSTPVLLMGDGPIILVHFIVPFYVVWIGLVMCLVGLAAGLAMAKLEFSLRELTGRVQENTHQLA